MNILYKVFLVPLFVLMFFTSSFAGNKDWEKQGNYLKVHKYKSTDPQGRPLIVIDYELKLPCFYTAPGNTPCHRGSFRKNGTGRSMPITSYKEVNGGAIINGMFFKGVTTNTGKK